MRERKFRALKNGVWHTLDLTNSRSWSRKLLRLMTESNTFIDFETPMLEFTGSRDKKGQAVYEGHIVKDKYTTFKVEFKWGGWRLERIKGPRGFPAFYDRIASLEVIGNIYQNPELLEGGSG